MVSLRHRPEIANPQYTELLAREAFLMATLPRSAVEIPLRSPDTVAWGATPARVGVE